jgi:hypothetical protein
MPRRPTGNIAKSGIADANGLLQHGCKHWLKVARRAADNLQHLRRRCLLLQRFGKFARALLLGLEQPHVLDGDRCLICECGDQFYLFMCEWLHFRAR